MRLRRTTPTALAILWILVWSCWLVAMTAGGRWGLFADNWFMSVTMAFGSFVAGATSEGGGAVAFPVMTLGFGIEPAVARDFSLMIQAVGMTSAGFTILFTRIQVERRALLWSSLGGAAGIVLGLELIAPRLGPSYAKMFFTATWLSFAFALYWVNRYHDREVYREIPRFTKRHAVMLLATGVLGGVISSITGSGLDIATFALLVLRLRISESVATPTSVVLMGLNALFGALYRGNVQHALTDEVWGYWWVCVPIVTVGAPFGARFIRERSRLFVAGLLYTCIAAQSVAAFFVVPQSPPLLAFSAAIFVAGLLFFRHQANRGVRRMRWVAGEQTAPQMAGEP